MKTEQFKEIVRAIVKEELQKTLPTLVPKIVAEALNGKSNKPSLVESTENEDFFEKLQREISGPAVPQEKPKKVFSKNPILNQVLNETEGGIPQDVSYEDALPRPNFKQAAQKIPYQSTAPTNILNETTKAQAEIGAFKDFRKLMKAVDAKKKGGSMMMGASLGGLTLEGGIPRDFSTID